MSTMLLFGADDVFDRNIRRVQAQRLHSHQ
jgi:hypothetical protein